MPDHYDDMWYCGDCDECMEFDCVSHPDNEWKYSPEAYESKFCPYSGMGSFNVGDEFCLFGCWLRKACEETYADLLWDKAALKES